MNLEKLEIKKPSLEEQFAKPETIKLLGGNVEVVDIRPDKKN